MNSELGTYLGLLVIGTILTLLVGSVLMRSGQVVLEEVYPTARAQRVTLLVTMGFVLFALGVLALISTVPVPVDGAVQTIVTKLGVVLLILSGSLGLALRVLARVRDASRQAELDQAFSATMHHRQ
ncbi:MAG TPA: hypothetical protein VFE65_30690 [Pseudonocardia sp.]|jgi:hypothetical protein|nr:hypothetical protein [Pseudonocardia sp.]